MKIVWVCNIMPVQIAKALGQPFRSINGWINVLYESLAGNPEIRLTVLFPAAKGQEPVAGTAGNVSYYSFTQNAAKPELYESALVPFFGKILEKEQPDVVHIWGSEYPHTLAMLTACEEMGLKDRAVVSIQGLISVCAKHYLANLPRCAVYGMTLRDFLRMDNVRGAQKKFERRGQMERKALEKAVHVIGRTEWDYACVKQLNPQITYHKANEILRESFYEGEWNPKKCVEHTIFMSQWGYPLKGFHLMLEALREVVREYPDAKLVTTGMDPRTVTGMQRVKQSYYHRYIAKLVKKWGLDNHVVFLGGEIKEEEMKEQYLSAQVFVLPSAIENSPNSMGEAMILGTPVVAANVGGISSLLTHSEEGFLYPFDESYMLAHYIKKLFDEEELALHLSENGKKRASLTHHREQNIARYYEIYEKISHHA